MLNLSVLLEDSAREAPDRDAVVFGDMRLPYAIVNTLANQIANLLNSRGIGRGDKVAISCPNLPYFPVVYYGILKAGAVVVPLNVLLKPREIAYHLDDSDATAYFCFEGTPELPMGEGGWQAFGEVSGCEHFFLLTTEPMATTSPIEGAEPLFAALSGMEGTYETALTEPGDPAVLLYTSGTTGQPKGAVLTHSNMLLNAMLSDSLYERRSDDVVVVTLPLFHSFGQTVLMNTGFYHRSTLVMLPRFDATEALRLMEQEKVTVFAGVPTMYWGLLACETADDFDLDEISGNLRIAISGGAALPLEVLNSFKKRFNVDILEGYGLSETSPVATFNRTDVPSKPGSIGPPVWGVDVRLIDADWNEIEGEGPGEIAIRGHNVMAGYYKRPEQTAEALRDGWFRTGDIARRDEDGYYFIVDRAKDMIVRGGFNVYPREVEEVLMGHPDVSLAAVIGVAHETHGEEVKAYVIHEPGAAIGEDELVAWSKENMASYKYPRIVEFRDDLPMTATGKILKRELR